MQQSAIKAAESRIRAAQAAPPAPSEPATRGTFPADGDRAILTQHATIKPHHDAIVCAGQHLSCPSLPEAHNPLTINDADHLALAFALYRLAQLPQIIAACTQYIQSVASHQDAISHIYSSAPSSSVASATMTSFKKELHSAPSSIKKLFPAWALAQLLIRLEDSCDYDDSQLLTCLKTSLLADNKQPSPLPADFWIKSFIETISLTCSDSNFPLHHLLQSLDASWLIYPGTSVAGSNAVLLKARDLAMIPSLSITYSASKSFADLVETAISSYAKQIVHLTPRESAPSNAPSGSTTAVVGHCLLVPAAHLIILVSGEDGLIPPERFRLRTNKRINFDNDPILSWDSSSHDDVFQLISFQTTRRQNVPSYLFTRVENGW
jgi:hypothetical protein